MPTNEPLERKRENHHWGWLIAIMLGIILFSTNPSETQFRQYIKNELISQSHSEGGALSAAFMELIAAPTTYMSTIVRSDCYVFSIYDINILGDRYKYIGIFNHFIQIKKY